jgi:hypothetical protein
MQNLQTMFIIKKIYKNWQMNYNQKEIIKHLERNGHKEPLKRKVGCLISKG